jgi:hypothetical protein
MWNIREGVRVLGIIEDEINKKTVTILLVRGENPDGASIYAYVAVRADKLEDFMRAQTSGIFYPEDYGVIIEAGESEPSSEVQKKMEEEYGFNHGGMVVISDEEKVKDVLNELDPFNNEEDDL